MPVTVAMSKEGHARIADRLEALGLDLDIALIDGEGRLVKDGKTLDPAATALDYAWLSPDLSLRGATAAAFDLVLALKSLDVLQTFNAGLDTPAYGRMADKGIRICNSSAQGVAIAEYVMAQALALIHPIAEQRQAQAERRWARTPFREVSEMTWLIVGYGPIGREVAKRAKVFGATISVIRRTPATSELVDRSGTLADLPAHLPDADVIVFACPLNEETRGLAGASFFSAVKPDAILINVARGGLIDEAALLSALDGDRLAAAVLDVFNTEPLPANSKLWGHPRIHITGHTSFNGSGTVGRWEQLFLDNIARYARGDDLLNEVAPADVPRSA